VLTSWDRIQIVHHVIWKPILDASYHVIQASECKTETHKLNVHQDIVNFLLECKVFFVRLFLLNLRNMRRNLVKGPLNDLLFHLVDAFN